MHQTSASSLATQASFFFSIAFERSFVIAPETVAFSAVPDLSTRQDRHVSSQIKWVARFYPSQKFRPNRHADINRVHRAMRQARPEKNPPISRRSIAHVARFISRSYRCTGSISEISSQSSPNSLPLFLFFPSSLHLLSLFSSRCNFAFRSRLSKLYSVSLSCFFAQFQARTYDDVI